MYSWVSTVFFFFSSRRRHTRCSRDWSSDVCSSDLSFPVAVICGVLGSIIGALANYFGAQLIGRPLLQRYGRGVLFWGKKLPRPQRFLSQPRESSQRPGRLFSGVCPPPLVSPRAPSMAP